MTLYIIIITCIVSLIAFSQPRVMDALIFDPHRIEARKEYYRFVTCGLLHADLFHLFVNMFVLYSFGQVVEYYYSMVFGRNAWMLYVALYVTSIFAANLSSYYKHKHNPAYLSLGASGAVNAVVFTAIFFNPFAELTLMFALDMPAIVYGILFLAYSYYMSRKDHGDNINHDAHLLGAIYGILFTIAVKPAVVSIFLNQLF